MDYKGTMLTMLFVPWTSLVAAQEYAGKASGARRVTAQVAGATLQRGRRHHAAEQLGRPRALGCANVAVGLGAGSFS